jgi:hypothetical protein
MKKNKKSYKMAMIANIMKMTAMQKQQVAEDGRLSFSLLLTGSASTVDLIVYFSLFSYTSASLTATQIDLMILTSIMIKAKAMLISAGVEGIPWIANIIK